MPRVNNPPAYRWPNTAELRAILNLLDKHVEVLPDDKCRYKPGWSDQAIADAVGVHLPRPEGTPPISASSVGNRRKELYGQIDEPNAVKKAPFQKLAELEARIAVLEDLLVAKK